MTQTRAAAHGVSPIFVERWSPRAYDESILTENDLKRLFEAAHWAPSAYNAQPWRFIYARRDTADWQRFVDLLVPGNRVWAQRASALVFAVSAQKFIPPGSAEAIDTGYSSYDTGAAVAYLILQASLAGLAAHVVGGFDRQAAQRVLAIPDGFRLESAIVIGRHSADAALSPELRAREAPNERRPIESLIAEGRFDFQG
ncbi:MAG: nitroreductase family protein [Candidatus Accumulibacter sp.]|jgi:nitroreductase|nr:nitroreductase family protein [Accumulibacter sp.]